MERNEAVALILLSLVTLLHIVSVAIPLWLVGSGITFGLYMVCTPLGGCLRYVSSNYTESLVIRFTSILTTGGLILHIISLVCLSVHLCYKRHLGVLKTGLWTNLCGGLGALGGFCLWVGHFTIGASIKVGAQHLGAGVWLTLVLSIMSFISFAFIWKAKSKCQQTQLGQVTAAQGGQAVEVVVTSQYGQGQVLTNNYSQPGLTTVQCGQSQGVNDPSYPQSIKH